MAAGRIVMELTDEKRKEFFNSEEQRKIVISIFYPTDMKHTDKMNLYSSLYVPCCDEFAKYFASKGVEKEHLDNLKTSIVDNAPLKKECNTLPPIIYSPGFGSFRDDCSFNAEKLVEQGFVVITIGHTYDAKHTIFPDGKVIIQYEGLHEAPSNDSDLMEKLIEIRKQDILFVLDSLIKINEDNPVLKNTMDLSKIGIMGHSLGGGAAFESAVEDSRIKAVMMLDCSLHRITSLKRLQSGQYIYIPFVNFRRDASSYRLRIRDFIDNYSRNLNATAFKERFLFEETLSREVETRQEALYKLLKGFRSFIRLRGAEHMTFTDYPIIMNRDTSCSALSIYRAHEIISDLTVRFFEEFLLDIKDRYSSYIYSKPYQEVCKIDSLGEDI